MTTERSFHVMFKYSPTHLAVAGGVTGDASLGTDCPTTMELYDVASGTWSEAAGVVFPQFQMACAAEYEGRIFIVGGFMWVTLVPPQKIEN